jgi:heme A synthase
MKLNRFAQYALLVLLYNLGVILWGAYVRASGAGAGCGSHWPLCNGEVIPRAPNMQTLIEFSHRLTSGVALLLVVGLVVWAFRAYARGHAARRWAVFSLLFILTEALIGAGLVLFEYVAENASIARALWMSGHLINTNLLLAALALTLWSAANDAQIHWRGQGLVGWLLALAFVGTMILGVSGAVTALGATLFPVTSLAEGLRQDLSPTAHVLIRLRFFHPFIALLMGVFLLLAASFVRAWRPALGTKRWAKALAALVVIQLFAGLSNLLLHAPIWLQLTHLLLADLVWIALVLLAVTALSQPVREATFRSAVESLA